jgi:hypothetical protein
MSRKMSISRTSAVAGQGLPRKTYIAMRNYQNDIYTYATSNVNFVTVGGITPYGNSYSNVCLQGNFLTETGHRLYPGTHPGVSTLMVSVMDYGAVDLSGNALKGFIDPTSFAFSPQTADRSYQVMNSGLNPNPSGNGVPVNSFPNDQGAPVFTHGDIKADGNAYFGGHVSTMGNTFIAGNEQINGNLVAAGTGTFSNNVNVVNGQVRASSVFQSTFGASSGLNTINIDPTLGQVFIFDLNNGNNNNVSIITSNFPAGAQLFFVLQNHTGSNRIYDFNNGFLSSNAGQNTVQTSTIATASFFCDGVHFLQLGGQNPVTQ